MAVTSLYRGLLRELRKTSINPRQTRSPIVQQQFRALLNDSKSAKDVEHAFKETTAFLRADRKHQELVARYNPTHDMTEEERVEATARRVGLDATKMGAKKY